MSGHTPGPWHVSATGFSRSHNVPTVYAADDELRYIAFCSDFSNQAGNETDNLANARLIAAAPDLLAAAQKMMDYEDSDYVPNGAFDMLHEAIAKARGEP